MLADLENNIAERGLLVYGVDAVGNPVTWLEPALIDVRFTVWGGAYNYKLDTLMRPLLKGPIEDKAFEKMVDECREHIIAGGRRHAMEEANTEDCDCD